MVGARHALIGVAGLCTMLLAAAYVSRHGWWWELPTSGREMVTRIALPPLFLALGVVLVIMSASTVSAQLGVTFTERVLHVPRWFGARTIPWPHVTRVVRRRLLFVGDKLNVHATTTTLSLWLDYYQDPEELVAFLRHVCPAAEFSPDPATAA